MATVTHATTALWATAAGTATNKNVTATPVLGDLIVVVAASSGLSGGVTAVTDSNADGLGTYTQVDVDRTGFSTTGVLTMWVRDALVGSATSTVFTAAQNGSSGGGLDVFRISGMSLAGASAVRQSAGQSSGTSGTTPAPVMGVAVLTGNPVIGAVGNGTSPATLTPRTGYTEATDLGYSTPTTGLETMFRSSGETGTTLTWGSTSGSTFASIAAEFDTSVPVATVISKDASTPAAVDNQGSTSATAVTASFSPPAGSTVAIAVCIALQGMSATQTVTVADSLGNNYTAGPSEWAFSANGVFFFQFYYSAAPGSITVTATRSAAGAGLFEINTWVLTGAAADQTGAAAPAGASGNTTSETSSITTTAANSWALCAIACSNVAPTASGLTEDQHHQDSTDGAMGAAGHSVTGTPGATTIGWTSATSFWAWAAWEILPGPYVLQSKVITGANSGSLDAATTAGNTLIVAYAGSNGAGSTGTCSTSGATLGGVSLTKDAEVDAPASASAGCVAIYRGNSIAGGQTAVAVTGTGLVAADAYLVAYEVVGLGASPALDVSSTSEDHSGTKAWSSDTGTAPATANDDEFCVGIHAAGPNSGQPDALGPAGSWLNETQFGWGSPGGASVAGCQVLPAGSSLRYNGTAADFDFCVTAAVAVKAASGSAVTADSSLPVTTGLAAAGQRATAATAALAATTSLAATGQRAAAADSALPATAALVATGQRAATGDAALPVTAALAATATVTTAGVSGDAALAITATLAATAALSTTGAATLSPTATLAAAGQRAAAGDASLPVAAGTAATGMRAATAASALPVTTGLVATGQRAITAAGALPVTTTLAGAAQAAAAGNAALPVTATLAATATVTTAGASGDATLPVTTGVAATAQLAATGTATLAAAASLAAAAQLGQAIAGQLPLTATPAAGARADTHAAAALAVTAALAATGNVPLPFTVGVLAASDAPAVVLTAAGAANALTATTAPRSTLTAADQRTGGPS